MRNVQVSLTLVTNKKIIEANTQTQYHMNGMEYINILYTNFRHGGHVSMARASLRVDRPVCDVLLLLEWIVLKNFTYVSKEERARLLIAQEKQSVGLFSKFPTKLEQLRSTWLSGWPTKTESFSRDDHMTSRFPLADSAVKSLGNFAFQAIKKQKSIILTY